MKESNFSILIKSTTDNIANFSVIICFILLKSQEKVKCFMKEKY